MNARMVAFFVAVVLIAGCIVQQPPITGNQTGKTPTESTPAESGNNATETPAQQNVSQTPDEKKELPVKEAKEGDLVSFPNLKAVDPDGDPITYTFTSPLNSEGKWQTEIGDVGEYVVTITASDGKNQAAQDVLIIVKSLNKPPVIEIADKLVFDEGETVKLEPKITDPDGDEVTVKYFGWMSSDTKETGYKDAGVYKVTIEASDGTSITSKEINIGISNVNRAPELKEISAISVTEGGIVTIEPDAFDADGDEITFEYGEPLDATGKWQTQIGDAGTYNIKVTAKDGQAEDSAFVDIKVEPKNRAPTITIEEQMEVDEGETVTLNPQVEDPEDDEFTVMYSGWMTSNTKKASFEDSGKHTVKITARDTGGHETEKEVVIIVKDVNRPPVFGAGAFL